MSREELTLDSPGELCAYIILADYDYYVFDTSTRLLCAQRTGDCGQRCNENAKRVLFGNGCFVWQ